MEETIEVNMNAIVIEALKELNLKVEALRARVEQMENEPISFKRGDRVKVKQTAGFHKGASGVVEFVEPSGEKIWVTRDGASSPVFYYGEELDAI
jgi:hypothetical protein